MSSKFLDLSLKVGGFFAITPISTESKNVGRSHVRVVHSMLMLIIILIAVVASRFLSCALCGTSSIKVILLAFMDVCLCAFNCNIVLNALLKKQKWNQLMDNLRTLDYNCTSGSNPERSAYVKFTIVQVVFWSNNIYIQSYLIYKFGLYSLFVNFSPFTFQAYMYFTHTSCIYAILEMIKLRYKNLQNKILANGTSQQLGQIENDAFVLSESVDLLNDIFGWPVVFQVSYTTLTIVNCLHNHIDFTDQFYENIQLEIVALLINLMVSVRFLYFCLYLL